MRFSITQRISAGYAVLLFMLVLVVSTAGIALTQAMDNFVHYRTNARASNVAADIEMSVLDLRLKMEDYLLVTNDESRHAVDDMLKQTEEQLIHAKASLSPAHWTLLEPAAGHFNAYKDTFHKIAELDIARTTLSRDRLDVLGPEVEEGITTLIQSSRQGGNAEAAILGADARRSLLKARLQVQKFEIYRDAKLAKSVADDLAAMKDAFTQFIALLPNQSQRDQAGQLLQKAKLYGDAFEARRKATVERDALIAGVLNLNGVAINKAALDVRTTTVAEQNDFGPKAAASVSSARTVALSIGVVAVAIGVAAAFLISRALSRPIVAMTQAMTELAGGSRTVDVPALGRRDEIGDMAQAVQVFKQNAIENDRLLVEQEEERLAKEARAQRVEQLLGSFDTAVQSVVNALAAAATEMEATARSMSSTAEETSHQASIVGAAATQTSANVQTVASAAEELSSTISDISRRVMDSSRIATRAAEDAKRTDETVQGLTEAVHKIGEVVQLINSIASQTNLLALNATIEAARAGEAGKGFAVVASEVKALANQTAKATDDIAAQINAIQNATQQAVSAIRAVTITINEINEISSGIAAAMQQQGAATQEIARNVNEAARGTSEVTSNIISVQQAATDTGAAAGQVLVAAGELSQHSADLAQQVNIFLGEVKAA